MNQSNCLATLFNRILKPIIIYWELRNWGGLMLSQNFQNVDGNKMRIEKTYITTDQKTLQCRKPLEYKSFTMVFQTFKRFFKFI
jgi:hypothetical protein